MASSKQAMQQDLEAAALLIVDGHVISRLHATKERVELDTLVPSFRSTPWANLEVQGAAGRLWGSIDPWKEMSSFGFYLVPSKNGSGALDFEVLRPDGQLKARIAAIESVTLYRQPPVVFAKPESQDIAIWVNGVTVAALTAQDLEKLRDKGAGPKKRKVWPLLRLLGQRANLDEIVEVELRTLSGEAVKLKAEDLAQLIAKFNKKGLLKVAPVVKSKLNKGWRIYPELRLLLRDGVD